MGIITTQDMEKIIEDFGTESDGSPDWYFMIEKKHVDGIKKWLDEYCWHPYRSWLDYEINKCKNHKNVYILRLTTK